MCLFYDRTRADVTKKQTPTADRPLKRFSSHAPVVRLKKESEMAIHRVRYRCSIWPGYSSSRTSATAQTYFGVGRSARVQTYDSSCPSLFFSLLRRGDMKTNKKVVIRITSFRAPATLWNKKKKPKRGVRPAHFPSPLSNIILHVTTTFAIFTLCPPP